MLTSCTDQSFSNFFQTTNHQQQRLPDNRWLKNINNVNKRNKKDIMTIFQLCDHFFLISCNRFVEKTLLSILFNQIIIRLKVMCNNYFLAEQKALAVRVLQHFIIVLPMSPHQKHPLFFLSFKFWSLQIQQSQIFICLSCPLAC